jgi:hypothetical protein
MRYRIHAAGFLAMLLVSVVEVGSEPTTVGTMLTQATERVGNGVRAGVVTRVHGSVLAKLPARPEVVLEAGTIVFVQDRITTLEDATLEMRLGDRIDVALHERSALTLDERRGRSTLDLHDGRLTLDISSGLRRGALLDLRTPNTIGTIRGRVRLAVEARVVSGLPLTDIEVFEGSIEVRTPRRVPPCGVTGTPPPTIVLQPNDGLTVTGDVAAPVRAARGSTP